MSPLLLCTALFAALPSGSCMCSAKRSVAEEFKAADAVFAGRVESVEPEDPSRPHDRTVTTFAVWRGYKSVREEAVSLKGWAHSDCSFSFQVRKLYVVYAFKTAAGELVSHTCSRTAHIEEAKEDLEKLPEPVFVKEK